MTVALVLEPADPPLAPAVSDPYDVPMSADPARTGMKPIWKLLLVALALGVVIYLVVLLLGNDSGSLQPYEGFN
ncbi:MAG TPA: hypothetical protein P5218_08580 [Planctomycetota bacterium]|nr:hypothetical protein [Planctomycetota bacterium]